jgi:hypothetical protein
MEGIHRGQRRLEEFDMLRPQDTSTRERKSLNGLWKFPLDKATEGRSVTEYGADTYPGLHSVVSGNP